MASQPNPFYIQIYPVKEEYLDRLNTPQSVDLPLVTLPAGTVLFRGLKIPNLKAGEDIRYFYRDFLGNPDGADMVCLEPTHNVFFYPFPYVAFGTHTIGPTFSMMQAVVLVQSVTVVCSISPADMVRGQTNMYDGTAPFQRCSSFETQYDCKQPQSEEERKEILKTKSYDNCINPNYAQRSDVRGWMAIADLDSIKPSINKMAELKYALKQQALKKTGDGKYTAAMSPMGKYMIGLEQRQPGLGAEALAWMYTDKNKKAGFPEIALYPYKRHYGPKLIKKICRNEKHAIAIMEKEAAFDNLNYLPLAAFTKDGTVDMVNGHFSYHCLGVSENSFSIPPTDQQSQIETRIREWMDHVQTKGINLPFYGSGKLSFDMRTGFYAFPQMIPDRIRIPMAGKDAKGRDSAPYSFLLLPLDTEEAKYRALSYMLLFRTFMPGQAMKMFGLLPKFGVPRAMIFSRPPVLKWVYDELNIRMPETYRKILGRAAGQYKKNMEEGAAEKKVEQALAIASINSSGEKPFFILYRKKYAQFVKQFTLSEWMSFTSLDYQKLLKAADREPSAEEKKDRIYKDNSAPASVKGKRDFYFKGSVPDANLSRIQVDDTALFSITEAAVADEQTRVIAETLGEMGIDTREATVTDGTANVGGNTISFAKAFEKVNAVEIAPLRAPLLANNVIVANLQDKVVVHCSDYLELWKNIEQDVIFMDPPWGGKGYKEQAVLNMFLGKTDVSDLIAQMVAQKAASVIAMKAPVNYNIPKLKVALTAGTDVKEEDIRIIPMKKQNLIVIKVSGAKRAPRAVVEATNVLYGAVTPPLAAAAGGAGTPIFYGNSAGTPVLNAAGANYAPYGAVTPPLAAAAAAGGGGENQYVPGAYYSPGVSPNVAGQRTPLIGGYRNKTRSNKKTKRQTRRVERKNPIEYAKGFASIWNTHVKTKRKETIE